MKILISIYEEDKGKDTVTLVFSKWLLTEWTGEQIERHFQLKNGFHSSMICGTVLSFYDIFCAKWDCADLIQKVDTIPECQDYHPFITNRMLLSYEEIPLDNVGASCHINGDNWVLVDTERYEWGAESFYTIVYKTLGNAIIGGVIWDVLKAGICFVFKRLRLCAPKWEHKQYMIFHLRRFYRRFSKLTRIKKNNFQIIHFSRTKNGSYSIVVRTIENERYKVKCTSFGKIEKLDLEDKL